MIEGLEKRVSEITERTSEITKKVDPDKRIDIHQKKNEILSSNGFHDPDKRIIPKQEKIETKNELSILQKSKLEENGMSPSLVEKCTVDKNDHFYLKTIHESMEGTKHPDTRVPYIRKELNINGVIIEGVFPDFKSKFTCYLDKENIHASDDAQFKDCMNKLRNEISRNPLLALKFTPRQLEQIRDQNSSRISNLTWHHNEELGKMELVDATVHDLTKHTGGKSIWSGGKENR